MKIGIIGIGNVGSTMGPLLSRCGHEVLFGARDPKGAAATALLANCEGRAQAFSVREVFARANLILLAVRWDDLPEVIAEAENLDGMVLIDCTTPLERGTHKPLLDWEMSSAEQLARWAKGAKVVKCFDTTGVEVMKKPVFDGVKASMFLCGDSAEAKERVRPLVEDLGFECIDAGPLTAARYLEALSAFWVFLAFDQGFGEDISYKLLRR
jgi:8-hydroxy-5-deazaflavin:NADPH oxidoreductase